MKDFEKCIDIGHPHEIGDIDNILYILGMMNIESDYVEPYLFYTIIEDTNNSIELGPIDRTSRENIIFILGKMGIDANFVEPFLFYTIEDE